MRVDQPEPIVICAAAETAILSYIRSNVGELITESMQGIGLNHEFPVIGYSESISDGTEFGTLNFSSGISFAFYRGESEESMRYPCVIVAVEQGQKDVATGNTTLQASVMIKAPSSSWSGQSSQTKLLKAASDAIINLMHRDDLESEETGINRFANDRFTYIGASSYEEAKGREGEDLFTHTVSITFEAAERNLITE
jgi:hypothetical protein